MAYLEEIPSYKDTLLHAITNNEKIASYIGNSDVEYNDDLIGVNIFPFPYIPDTQSEVKTYICFDIYVPRVQDKMFKTVRIEINVFSHKNMKLHKNKTIVDLINIELDKLLNGNQDFGYDSANLICVSPYIPSKEFYGKTLIYDVPNFNQKRCKHNEHKI